MLVICKVLDHAVFSLLVLSKFSPALLLENHWPAAAGVETIVNYVQVRTMRCLFSCLSSLLLVLTFILSFV